MIECVNGKRIWFITDTHLGVRNNSNEWIEIMEDYFNNFFLPLVEKNYRKGDVLFHLGDVYDSRQSINIRVLNFSVSLFERLSSIFKDGIYIIAGNHDIWGRSSNEINSLSSIKWIPNVNILEEPDTIKIGKTKILMMPWRKTPEDASSFLDSSESHDILCCHADIQGLKYNKYVQTKEGSSVSDFVKFRRVYSGHIHYSQKLKNINMLGSPYELTRSDCENPKFINLLDLETMDDYVFYNTHSPKFKRFYFEDIVEMTPEELISVTRNNFVDIMINPIKFPKVNFNLVIDLMEGYRSVNLQAHETDRSENVSDNIIDSSGRHFTILEMIEKHVSSLEEDDTEKNKILSSLNKLYSIVINKEDENN